MAGTKARHKRVIQFKSNQEIMDTLAQSYTTVVQPLQPVMEQQVDDIHSIEETLPEDDE